MRKEGKVRGKWSELIDVVDFLGDIVGYRRCTLSTKAIFSPMATLPLWEL